MTVTRIELRPSIPSWAERPQDFDGVVDALSEGDAEVVLIEPPGPPEGGIPQAAGMDFVIQLAGDIGPYFLPWLVAKLSDALLAAAKQHKRETPMMGVIYGPDGEILREVEVHPEDQ